MKEPHSEGVAIHADLESCAGGGDTTGEALTEAPAGWVLSRERTRFGRRRNALMRKATPTRTPSRVCVEPGAVGDPTHAGKLPAREPGDLVGVCQQERQTAGQRPKPYGPHARRRGVGQRGSTDEAAEQRRQAPAGATRGGGRGGKRVDQGEHGTVERGPDTEPGTRVEPTASCASSFDAMHPR